jgi:hypothetical protein
MAKAQKKTTEKDDGKAKAAAGAAKKPAAAAKGKSSPAGGAKKPAATRSTTQAPLIDTNLAASAAAAMILNRAVTGAAGTTQPAPAPTAPQGETKKESVAFKNMKDSLSKPAGSGLGGILGNTGQQKKSNLPFGGGKQVGRNQTFGADVNRAGVPRRTGGG